MVKGKYLLGLDIGTDSVGYAATDTSPEYALLKHHGEPLWGVTLFEQANLSADRRAHRTDRRRIDRRQQRVLLVQEIFAQEIGKIDPDFYRRIRESALLREDRAEPYCLFNDPGYTDAEYHKQYPTIHHLICELMHSEEPHDVRLVYLACAWLVAHRGHFLSEVSADNVTTVFDFPPTYRAFLAYCRTYAEEEGYAEPWSLPEGREEEFGAILKLHGVQNKKQKFRDLLFGGQKIPKTVENADGKFPFSVEAILVLLAGGKAKIADLYRDDEYEDLGSFSLGAPDEEYQSKLASLGDDGELLCRLKAMYDWAVLCEVCGGERYISVSKVKVYEQHKKDLAALKAFVKENYGGEMYGKIFRQAKEENNYVAYSGKTKDRTAKYKTCKDGAEFCAFLRKTLALDKEENAGKMPADMLQRIRDDVFMPKQVTGDNRVLPYQLYYAELKEILEKAKNYLPFLVEKDADGYRTDEKLLSVMRYRIPYYVGPLNPHSEHAWIERRGKGRIYPWNLKDMVDLDKSEEAFIRRMTNTCTYLAGEDVLPLNSLLYQKFMVLNEINNLKIGGVPIDVALKQKIYGDLFSVKKKVTRRALVNYLLQNGITQEEAQTLSGIDTDIKATLSSRISFRNLMEGGILTEEDVENIICRRTYCEDNSRFRQWLTATYTRLEEKDVLYILSLHLKDFGRLSGTLLSGIEGTDTETGETHTILGFLWEKNVNLSTLLLSDRYTFAERIRETNAAYYSEHPQNLNDRLKDMYVSNAVKRPIIRTLEIVADVVKATGKAPEKIFVEMARGAAEGQKHKRTKSRSQQLRDYYSRIDSEDVRELCRELDAYGDAADNKLQSDKLFLYFMQLGKCMYTGEPIRLEDLMSPQSKRYDIDHIYPQSRVDDDSLLNNKVLVVSEENHKKGNRYPIRAEIRERMGMFWKTLCGKGLITEEKFRRLTRATPFNAEEEWGFVNRQLVETRQSTKVITTLLAEKYPTTEIVFVKAGLVSKFRHEYDLLKSRAINDLHHAKDAYLNVVCGQVYHSIFTKQWFLANRESQEYTVNMKTLFHREQKVRGEEIWSGSRSLGAVRKVVGKNHCHLTVYAFCRHGGLFDQQPVKRAKGLIPRKSGLPTEKYGGYNKPGASFFALALCTYGKKREVMLLPVELLVVGKYDVDEMFAKEYLRSTAEKLLGKKVEDISFPLGMRKLKINTVFEADGFRMCLSGKSSGGLQLIFKPLMPLILSPAWETYIKKLETFDDKKAKNANISYDPDHEVLTPEKNAELYRVLTDKITKKPFKLRPTLVLKKIVEKEEKFTTLSFDAQVKTLLNFVSLFARSAMKDDFLKLSDDCVMSSKLSNWKKYYQSVCIVDSSASGIWESQSRNLLSFL